MNYGKVKFQNIQFRAYTSKDPAEVYSNTIVTDIDDKILDNVMDKVNYEKEMIFISGPFWKGGLYHEEKKLRFCIKEIFKTCIENKVKIIAIPFISTG